MDNSVYLIDTDGGIDDIFALAYAVNEKPNAIKAFTTVSGNISNLQAAYNIKYLLSYVFINNEKINIPVYLGAYNPLAPITYRHAFDIHGEDGFGNIIGKYKETSLDSLNKKETAANTIIDNANIYSKDLTIITLGPMTNVAISYLLNPNALKKIKRIVAMGGVLYARGNYNRVAEFNIGYDPFAFYIILTSGIPLELITLDLTKKYTFRTHDFIFNKDNNIFYRASKFYSKEKDLVYLHDPLAVFIAFEGNKYSKTVNINIELMGKYTKGCIFEDKNSNYNILYHYDVLYDLFREKILQAIKNFA
jgi:inosine-uridine nucleoside N-ribohydrolase